MVVVNIWAGPGAGKSTFAAELFAALKKRQIDCELITEYAKDLIWEDRQNILDDQLYILAKQNRKIARLQNKGIKFAITDSPILLGALYYKGTLKIFPKLILETFYQYNNVNFFLKRPEVPYKCIGRQQSFEEACDIDEKIKIFLDANSIKYKIIDNDLEKILTNLHCYADK